MEVFISNGYIVNIALYTVRPLMARTLYMLQLSQLQAELEEDWKGKCEQMLASAKEQHRRELVELTEQRDALQDKLTQLQEKVDNLVKIKHKSTHTSPSNLILKFVSLGVDLKRKSNFTHSGHRNNVILGTSLGLHYGKCRIYCF